MIKNFKSNFCVQGSPAQLAAFKEWAVSIGCDWEADVDAKFIYADKGVMKALEIFVKGTPIFNLPHKWSEAMAATETIDIVFEDGDWVEFNGEIMQYSDDLSDCYGVRPATPEEIKEAITT